MPRPTALSSLLRSRLCLSAVTIRRVGYLPLACCRLDRRAGALRALGLVRDLTLLALNVRSPRCSDTSAVEAQADMARTS
jgi:hypothetical protein